MEELDKGWQIIKGNKPVLIVAGHNFNQIREGEEKWADLGSGDVARRLCEEYSCFGIISTRIQEDPNWYRYSPFREKIREIIKDNNISLVVDIHGKSMGCNYLIELYVNQKFRHDFEVFSLQLPLRTFKEDDQLTICEELDETVAALEIEIREDGRVKTINQDIYKKATKMLDGLMSKLILDIVKD